MSKNVKSIRVSLELSQAKLADLLKVHVMTVSNWERGRQEIGIDVARKLIKLAEKKGFTITLDDIYGAPQKRQFFRRAG